MLNITVHFYENLLYTRLKIENKDTKKKIYIYTKYYFKLSSDIY